MEFVVLKGGDRAESDQLANRMRAHGYHYFSPDMFFMDDFGDIHFDADDLPKAKAWCAHHALKEVQHHHDVVLNGILVNEELLELAEKEGYHIKVIELDQDSPETCKAAVDNLISIHEKEHPSLLNRLAHQFFR